MLRFEIYLEKFLANKLFLSNELIRLTGRKIFLSEFFKSGILHCRHYQMKVLCRTNKRQELESKYSTDVSCYDHTFIVYFIYVYQQIIRIFYLFTKSLKRNIFKIRI